ncbi:hypothetical protein EH220_04460 [bacterium]|nr:MAG: hypothetical protein EH220_04460 [bacterium]
MPGGDRTGPLGMGPRTGRAAGFCSGNDQPGYAGSRGGRGRGLGLGRGLGQGYGRRGRGMRFRNPSSPLPANRALEGEQPAGTNSEIEIQELQRQSKTLQSELNSIQKRLAELENQGS